MLIAGIPDRTGVINVKNEHDAMGVNKTKRNAAKWAIAAQRTANAALSTTHYN